MDCRRFSREPSIPSQIAETQACPFHFFDAIFLINGYQNIQDHGEESEMTTKTEILNVTAEGKRPIMKLLFTLAAVLLFPGLVVTQKTASTETPINIVIHGERSFAIIFIVLFRKSSGKWDIQM